MDNPMREEILRQVLKLSRQSMSRLEDIAPCIIVPPVEIHWTYMGGTDSIN